MHTKKHRFCRGCEKSISKAHLNRKFHSDKCKISFHKKKTSINSTSDSNSDSGAFLCMFFISLLFFVLASTLFKKPEFLPSLEKVSTIVLNDSAIKKNWGLFGTNGLSDVRANNAWKTTIGSKKIVVAIIDTGIDVDHIDLKNNLWINKKEIPNNGIDDDQNGCIDDIHGCNLAESNGDLTDNHGHGTHIAGIIGAVGGNGVGVSGVAPRVSLMALKYYDPTVPGRDNLANVIKAIDYAIEMKVDIINFSGGGLSYSHAEFEAIKRAETAGILFVTSSGNERSNSDQIDFFPSNYKLSNILSVAAIDPDARVLGMSNYGKHTVNIGAPGERIYSTLPGNRFGTMTGTSMAAPFVTGAAVLIKAKFPKMSYQQIKHRILSRASIRPDLISKTTSKGILNIEDSLLIIPNRIEVERLPASLK